MLILTIVLVFIEVLYFIIVLFYVIGWIKTKEYKKTDKEEYLTKVSVIISARNEEENIENILTDLYKQDYPGNLFEILIVDDNSEDRTKEIVKEFSLINRDKKIKLVEFNEQSEIKGKKGAISKAIGEADGTLIITTDADCRVGEKWISTIVSYYQNKKYVMISGPVSFYREKSVFQKMQSVEFSGLIGVTCGAIYFNKPIMCNGANLAYEKFAFINVGGYENNGSFASGDDVMLMLKIMHIYKNKIGFVKSMDANVLTRPKETLREFWEQRKRWVSKSKYIRNYNVVFVSLVVYLANLFVIVSIVMLFLKYNIEIMLIIILIMKFLIDFILLLNICRFLKNQGYLKYFFLEEIINIVYVSLIGIVGNLIKYSWKNRLTK